MSPLTRRIFKNTDKKSVPPSTTNQKNGSTFVSPDIDIANTGKKTQKDEINEEFKEVNMYSDEYYDQMVKQLIDNP